jgi:hypothetical protein
MLSHLTSGAAMSGIFLSYRRQDASGWAGRLYEHLAREWGPDHVFMDIDAIAPGEDFRVAISRTLETCQVVLVVIGPNWLTARSATGTRRLDDDGDTHREEVAAALASDVRVIPVLVGGADMPRKDDLPEPVRDLVYRNAAVVEDRRFATDVETLQQTLRGILDGSGTTPWAPPDSSPRPRRPAATPPRGPVADPAAAPSRPPAAPDAVLLTLAIVGLVLVAFGGVLADHGWHNENAVMRIVASVVLVAGAVAGLVRRRWRWVLLAGIAGGAGLTIWAITMISSHAASGELGELVALSAAVGDGVENLTLALGVVLVLLAGSLGVQAESRGG